MKVRLKRAFAYKCAAANISFNSMKVRLKPVLTYKKEGIFVFQFHEGPIKTEPNRFRVVNKVVSIP